MVKRATRIRDPESARSAVLEAATHVFAMRRVRRHHNPGDLGPGGHQETADLSSLRQQGESVRRGQGESPRHAPHSRPEFKLRAAPKP